MVVAAGTIRPRWTHTVTQPAHRLQPVVGDGRRESLAVNASIPRGRLFDRPGNRDWAHASRSREANAPSPAIQTAVPSMPRKCNGQWQVRPSYRLELSRCGRRGPGCRSPGRGPYLEAAGPLPRRWNPGRREAGGRLKRRRSRRGSKSLPKAGKQVEEMP